MTRYILDTNALSEPMKPKPDKGYTEWLNAVDEAQLFISCLTLGELQSGIGRLSPSKKRSDYEAFLRMAIVVFDNRILPVDTQTSIHWGELTAASAKAGHTAPQIDALIAAQCIQHGATLVTRNVKDFQRFAGVNVLNPCSHSAA